MNALLSRPASATQLGWESEPAWDDSFGNEEDGWSDETDDACWEVFVADDDERDPLPEPGDFWTVLE
jgi:hypothetical protein